MGNQTSTSSQIISLPKGGGALKGIGEKFSPDLQTGTGNFTVPLALPPGRNGFQPQLNLAYSTGNGNGLFGLGWSLSVPGVTRKTSKGIPRYRDKDRGLDPKHRDTFILSGAEDLVPLDELPATLVRYRPRTEGLFARIEHHHDTNDDYWQVSSKDGLVSFYGTPHASHIDPAVIRKPKLNPADLDCLFSWKLTLTRDPFGNRIEYLYEERDHSTDEDLKNGHDLGEQPLLKRIRYVDHEAGGQLDFLVNIKFEYESRPDAFSDYRAGFEVRTTKRCNAILIETHADKEYKVRRYEFQYSNDALNGASHLTAIHIVGFDDQGNPSEELPSVDFAYTDFNPQDRKRRDFYPIQGKDLPASSLANPSLELVDLFGNGLPDILEMNGSVRYWRNRGNGRFDIPRSMQDAPAGYALADAGVQLIDANGDGRTDLLITQPGLAGYFPLEFGAKWDRRSMRKYEVAPSFNLKDPEVRLVDLTGDGVTDVIRSGSRLECFFNDPLKGWHETRWVERKALVEFPNVNFSDSRVKWSDMSGDGLLDIVLVYDGNVEYWPNLGYGDWGNRIHMRNSPRLPLGYDPKRILVGDVDGDGLADLIYVEDRKIHLWINQSGNAWSNEIVIQGTPPVSNMDAVRLTDLLGSGVSGILWTRAASLEGRARYFFLDLTGGTKPYLLHEMNNNMGALTRVGYAPSTKFYLEDEKKKETRWKTPLPFPVQVVAQVEVIDELSRVKLTTEYNYHNGYWDGAEREFRGFGMVEQFDTESFDNYGEPGLHGVEALFAKVDQKHFSDPTLTKTWFHQGPIGEEFGDWKEQEWSDQYWQEDPQLLKHTESVNAFLSSFKDRRVKRDALRTLRGSILRTELYAMDGTELEDRPYTVIEYAYGLREESQPGAGDNNRPHVFFAHALGQRTTQWERGDDPLTQFNFTSDFDDVGQPLQQTQIACPRGWRKLDDSSPGKAYLVTRSRTVFATPLDSNVYIRDRAARTTTYEIRNSANMTVTELHELTDSDPALAIIGQSLNFYDRDESTNRAAFLGLPFGKVGKFGALVRTENLVLTDEILQAAYGTDKPPYLAYSGSVNWSADYPQGFRTALPPLAGYTYQPGGAGSKYTAGYFVAVERRRYDFHAGTDGRGLVLAKRDPLGRDTTVSYDDYDLFPTEVTDSAGLQTKAEYNYRVLQSREVADPNGNRTRVNFTPLGLPKDTRILGKTSGEGDQQRPSCTMEYDFLAFARRGEPIYVRTLRQLHHDTETDVPLPQRDETIEKREYSDGFGRLLQTRTQAEDLVFADSSLPPARYLTFGNTVVPRTQPDVGGDVIGYAAADPINTPRVAVSGWQVYDNKGKVVEKFEPFFSEGWSYALPTDDQLGQKAILFYDPRGQVIRTENPDGSEQRVIYGVPINPDDPLVFTPTPWEAYTYDANDNAGRTHPVDSKAYRHHYNTPANILTDALGRTIVTVERNRAKPVTATSALPAIEEVRTHSTYDIQGNLLTVTDSLNRIAFSHVYDLGKLRLRTDTIDAGTRTMVFDATGNEIERRDSKGALALRSYDILHRPGRMWARNDAVQSMTLREKLTYGDGGRSDQPAQERVASRANNSLGKPVVHKDEAGGLSVDAYDFKGNLLAKTRKVIADESIIAALDTSGAPARTFTVDWDNPPSLEGAYVTSMTYDALNRIKTIQYPEDVGDPQQPPARKELRPHYNGAGALERVTLDAEIYVERIAYNAKGQRIFIAYGNGIMTRHGYDPKTFRLIRMRTEKYLTPLPALGTYRPSAGLLQDYAYEYDLAGNILAINERVPGCGVNGSLDGSEALNRQFQYDPLYRLTRATGRESINISNPRPWEDLAREGYNSGNHGRANQDNAPNLTREYWEAYDYDPAGNMLALKHSNNWTRRFGMAGFTPKQWQEKVSDFLAGGSPAWGTQGNRLTNFGTDENQTQSHTFDSNGNLTREYTNRHFRWDYADRMIAFADRATNASPASKEAIYLYDAGGQRLKKLVRLQTGEVETTTYIDGVFERHRWSKPGQPTIQNDTLHVMDNRSHVAMVRVGDAFAGDGASSVSVKYHLGDHLGSSNIVIGGATASGNTFINREEYFAYGETSFGSFGRKRFCFTGKERDEESGLNYHSARYYASWLVRWVSADPLGASQGANGYLYARQNPLRLTDPGGLAASTTFANPAQAEVSGAEKVAAKYSKVGPVADVTPKKGITEPGVDQHLVVGEGKGAVNIKVDVKHSQAESRTGTSKIFQGKESGGGISSFDNAAANEHGQLVGNIRAARAAGKLDPSTAFHAIKSAKAGEVIPEVVLSGDNVRLAETTRARYQASVTAGDQFAEAVAHRESLEIRRALRPGAVKSAAATTAGIAAPLIAQVVWEHGRDVTNQFIVDVMNKRAGTVTQTEIEQMEELGFVLSGVDDKTHRLAWDRTGDRVIVDFLWNVTQIPNRLIQAANYSPDRT
ncbi:hypothetical protein BH18ACI4_BH18ACI4_20010 [soil metagenome]